MNKYEIRILKNKHFLRRIINYDYEDIALLISHAWYDTERDTFTDYEDYTLDFLEICEAIRIHNE